VTLFVYLAPFMEQDNLTKDWHLTDPLVNTQLPAPGPTAKTATKVPILLCPSDVIRGPNPVDTGSNRWYALTSYGGNGGSRSYDSAAAANDGIFYLIGPGSQTAPNGQPVKMADVTDGMSNTADRPFDGRLVERPPGRAPARSPQGRRPSPHGTLAGRPHRPAARPARRSKPDSADGRRASRTPPDDHE
jgi:Protein of unknown function (DUF1559)